MVSKLVNMCQEGFLGGVVRCELDRSLLAGGSGEGLCRVEYLGLLRICYEYILCVDMGFHVSWKGVCSPVVCRVAVSLFIPPAKCALPLPCLLTARGSVSLYFSHEDGRARAGCGMCFPGDSSR